jgi:RimJ/RimL family protein N-acetyltransferase
MLRRLPQGRGAARLALVGPLDPARLAGEEVGLDGPRRRREGTGIAREAAEAALGYVWRVLNWDTVVSYIAEGNDRSVRLAERLGARLDPAAPGPEAVGRTVLVYRHPRPEGLA